MVVLNPFTQSVTDVISLYVPQATGMLQQVVDLASDQHQGFSRDAIASVVDMTKTGSSVNVGDIARQLDVLSSAGL